MDKNTIIGLGLMLLVILGFSWLNRNNETPASAAPDTAADTQTADPASGDAALPLFTQAEADAVAAAVMATDNMSADSVYTYSYKTVNLVYDARQRHLEGTVTAGGRAIAAADVLAGTFADDITLDQRREAMTVLHQAVDNANTFKGLASHRDGKAETRTLDNGLVRIDVSSHGAVIERAVLGKYYTYFPDKADAARTDTADVVLFEGRDNAYGFTFSLANQQLNTAELYYDLDAEASNDTTLVYKVPLGRGAYWGIRYTLPRDSYVVRMDVVQRGVQALLPASTSSAAFTWNQKMRRQELGRTFEEQKSGIVYRLNSDSPDDLGDREKAESLNQTVRWVAFKNQYFSSVLIADKPMTSARLAQAPVGDTEADYDYVKEMEMQATLDYNVADGTPATFHLYLGPNLYPMLDDLSEEIVPGQDLDLTRLVPLGWSWLRWINTLIIFPVFTFLGGFISDYGLIIFLLTLFIKLIIFPFTYKSYMSQAKMRVLAPEIKEINDKYPGKENAMTRQSKTMELYSRAGASPMSGCLPMLLQMPILIAMFWFFPSCIELRGQSFLWAHNLAAPDVIFTLPFSIPGYGSHVSLFCLLMTAVNIIYTRINMQNQPSSSQMPAMKWMMYLMPVMFLVFFNQYAAALSYYYFLSLLITILQTWIFRRCINEDKVRARMLENARKPRKKSGFAARLEAAQKRQQAMLREQQRRGGRK